MIGLRVLVCGGRDFSDYAAVAAVLNRLDVGVIIEGGASGADRLAMEWAAAEDAEHIMFKADWLSHGRAAGPIRNQRMLDEGKPDLVVAFPGGRGTADMVRRAKAAGVKVVEADA